MSLDIKLLSIVREPSGKYTASFCIIEDGTNSPARAVQFSNVNDFEITLRNKLQAIIDSYNQRKQLFSQAEARLNAIRNDLNLPLE